MKFDNIKDRKVYNVDLDGTLTYNEPWWDVTPKVNPIMRDYIRDLLHNGHIIIIWTARPWNFANETVGWLIANKIQFHGLMMGKGGADYYIDDKAINALELTKELEKKSDNYER